MAEILTVEEARNALDLPSGESKHDGQLRDYYVPSVTSVIEDLIGPVMQGTRTFTADGGSAAVVLPYLNTVSVDVVTESGVDLDPTGYTADLASGIIYRGTADAPLNYQTGRGAVVIQYTAGQYQTTGDVPANIKLAARIILAHLWQADHAGFRPQFGAPDDSTVMTPSGYAVPRRAVQLLGKAANAYVGFS